MQPVGAEGFLVQHEELLREGVAGVITVRLGNGRVISIRHQPIADGGWVATHHDITDEITRTKELRLQSLRLETALENMRQGLCMFDRDKRLIVSNRRYAEMYGIPPDKVRPGMSVDEILRQRFDAGNVPVEGMNVFVDKRLGIVAENEPCTFDVEMTDGRVISILHQPFDNGCWVATHEDMTEQRRHQARIRHLAGHDPLTDLPNRILFRRHLEETKTRTRNGETVGVLYIDLDCFKGVNDTLGHAAGDVVLTKVAQALVDCLRDGDVVARLGGDEFALLAGRLDRAEDAAGLAERIVKKLAEPLDINGHRVVIGASVGIAIAPIDGDDGESLMSSRGLGDVSSQARRSGNISFL